MGKLCVSAETLMQEGAFPAEARIAESGREEGQPMGS